MPFRFLPVFLVLMACGAPAPNDVSELPVVPLEAGDSGEENGENGEDGEIDITSPDIEECDAEVFRSAIGTDISTTAFEATRDVRIFSETDIVTQEYLPKRTNIVYDTQGIITRVYCG